MSPKTILLTGGGRQRLCGDKAGAGQNKHTVPEHKHDERSPWRVVCLCGGRGWQKKLAGVFPSFARRTRSLDRSNGRPARQQGGLWMLQVGALRAQSCVSGQAVSRLLLPLHSFTMHAIRLHIATHVAFEHRSESLEKSQTRASMFVVSPFSIVSVQIRGMLTRLAIMSTARLLIKQNPKPSFPHTYPPRTSPADLGCSYVVVAAAAAAVVAAVVGCCQRCPCLQIHS